MIRFIFRRVLGLVPVLAVAVVLAFVATKALPGDPVMAIGLRKPNVKNVTLTPFGFASFQGAVIE